ncbi:MAG: bifunctional riboflavin kinase/FAD synthetase [Chitinophagaceae bacterium]
MTVHKNLDHLPAFTNAVITIGTFDGVHTGHLQIINQLKEEAKAVGGESVIITFHPHPRRIIQNQITEIRLINTLGEKIELLGAQGIDHLVIVPFTKSFSDMSANDYIENFLVKYFHPHTIIIGYDHRFGHNREGDYHLLEDLKLKLNYKVKEIPGHVLQNSAISSTRIRQAIINGQIATANECLGYDYFFEGLVIEGNKLGRTIGYPTANLRITDDEKLVPGNGVYAVEVTGNWGVANGKKEIQPLYQGMMNIGVRPTVDGTKRTIEVNIFDFDKDIYGQTIRVYVKAYLRGEVKFAGLDALKEQLGKDALDARRV